MWVFCCGMKRAGSTVQYQLTAEIVETLGAGKRIGFIKPNEFDKIFNDNKNYEGILVVKLHDYSDRLSQLFGAQKAKAVYVYRDIRDVSVSLIAKGDRVFWRFILSGDIDDVLSQYKLWTSHDDILISRYETMVLDLSHEATRIADFLGLEINNETAELISAKYSIGEQKQRISQFDYNKQGFSTGIKKKTKVDPYSLLHENHIHSGLSGQWKTELTPFQTGLIEYLGFNWMNEVGYPISQKWVKQEFVGFANKLNRGAALLRFITKHK